MKIKKSELKNLIRETVKEQLSEGGLAHKRIKQLDRFKTEAAVSYMELLEDIIEQLDEQSWNNILEGLKEKYGYL